MIQVNTVDGSNYFFAEGTRLGGYDQGIVEVYGPQDNLIGIFTTENLFGAFVAEQVVVMEAEHNYAVEEGEESEDNLREHQEAEGGGEAPGPSRGHRSKRSREVEEEVEEIT